VFDTQPIAYRDFVDGACRPIYEDERGQYVLDDEGERVYGVYFIPDDAPDLPIIVDGTGTTCPG
jgi:hypothetical protein